jgi:putative heme-binding domain-containing protein
VGAGRDPQSASGHDAGSLETELTERTARRLMREERDARSAHMALADLIQHHFATRDRTPIVKGVVAGLREMKEVEINERLSKRFDELRKAIDPDDPLLIEFAARLGDADAIDRIERKAGYFNAKEPDRLWAFQLLRTLPGYDGKKMLLEQLGQVQSDPLRLAVLDGLQACDDPEVGRTVLKLYPKWSAAVEKRAVQALLSRPSWATVLFQTYADGKFPKADLTVDHARAAVALNDPELTKLVEKQFGKITPATPGEKKARIDALNLMMSREKPGDAAKGKAVFEKSCAACHPLFGEGGKVGPDLTTADRKNRMSMLTNVVDPSGYIRPEFITHKVNTHDGRTMSGVVVEKSAESLTLANYVNNKVEKASVAKRDIDTLEPSGVSLMPEKLLDVLSETEIRDLFAYVMQDAPKAHGRPSVGLQANPDRKGGGESKKLKVALISGSLEYKSDDTLPVFQKLLEDKYPVECVRMFRKTDTDIPGLDKLAECDVAIFFTRRLKIDGEQLKAVKAYCESGKPVIGIRTSSHGFQNWLEMDKDVFGGNYKGHFGAGPKCETKATDAGKNHPILKGVKPFESEGSLYKNPDLPKDVTVLLTGTAKENTEPIAWVRERKVGDKTQRVFYTSLGHPKDFDDENFTRLLRNAIGWCAGDERLTK